MRWVLGILVTLGALMLALVIAVALFLFSLDREKTARSQPDGVPVPVHWVDAQTVLTVSATGLSLRDTGGGEREIYQMAEGWVFDPGGGCYNGDTWIFSVARRSGTTTQWSGEELSGRWQADRFVADGEPQTGPRRNPVDCRALGDRPELTPGSPARPDDALLAGSDAEDVAYEERDGALHLLLGTGSEAREVVLEPVAATAEWQDGYGPDARRNPADGSYLLWQRGLRAHWDDTWPRSFWVLQPGAETAEALAVPGGPFIGNHGESLICFSCGCGCYQYIDVQPAGAGILAHSYGYGFPVAAQGLHLFTPEAGWRTVRHGVVTPPVVAPDGCRVAFHGDGFETLNLCEAG
ncbi:hypothetical protein [Algicella marina]|uniref:Uncharacterized protein n=1 Tax=Algicella marina TaxID=2683284 RepID=A0A6P1SZY8_9RHOB|nr:hypothetical protein [Algicella marina]QHQ35021.1 hypothetical protein GO499_07340 [Algicella marina]